MTVSDRKNCVYVCVCACTSAGVQSEKKEKGDEGGRKSANWPPDPGIWTIAIIGEEQGDAKSQQFPQSLNKT